MSLRNFPPALRRQRNATFRCEADRSRPAQWLDVPFPVRLHRRPKASMRAIGGLYASRVGPARRVVWHRMHRCDAPRRERATYAHPLAARTHEMARRAFRPLLLSRRDRSRQRRRHLAPWPPDCWSRGAVAPSRERAGPIGRFASACAMATSGRLALRPRALPSSTIGAPASAVANGCDLVPVGSLIPAVALLTRDRHILIRCGVGVTRNKAEPRLSDPGADADHNG